MAIDVHVTEQCHRCKRKEQITISSDKVGEFEQKQVEAKARQSLVEQFVAEQKGQLPDLVVIFKGKVKMLSQICDAHCTSTVQNNVDALFREHKPRQPKTQEERAAAKLAKSLKKAETAASNASGPGNGTDKVNPPSVPSKDKGKNKPVAPPA